LGGKQSAYSNDQGGGNDTGGGGSNNNPIQHTTEDGTGETRGTITDQQGMYQPPGKGRPWSTATRSIGRNKTAGGGKNKKGSQGRGATV